MLAMACSQNANESASAFCRAALVVAVFSTLPVTAAFMPLAAPQIELLPSAMWPINWPRARISGVGLKA